jgi:hypothetical protein
MIKECILAKTGILFDLKYLKESLGFDFNGLLEEMHEKNITPEDLSTGYEDLRNYAGDIIKQEVQTHHDSTVLQHLRDLRDETFDKLTSASAWWLLECFPTLFMHQDPAGDWICIRRYMFLPQALCFKL